MPTYMNTLDVPKILPGWKYSSESAAVPSGDSIATQRYVRPLPVGFVLTSDEPYTSPSVKLHDSTLPVSITSGLSYYGQIEITNESGAVITCTFNGDSSNTRKIPSGQFRVFEQDVQAPEIESLAITGLGASPVYVYGSGGA